jgi:hypothetical protein
MATNLPIEIKEDSAAGTKLYFDSYGEEPLEFNANDVDVTVGFFQKAGFDQDAALVVSMTLLRQAKIDGVPIYQILDTIKGFENLQLSQLVGEILNNNRVATSTLGFRIANVIPNQSRNIAA